MRRNDRGASLVETAVIVPFLLLLALGVMDLARAYLDAAMVQEAAQEGAVFASIRPGEPDMAVRRAEEAIADIDFTGSITVTCPANDQVTVTVTHRFRLLTPFIGSIFGESIDLTHSETAHVLNPNPCVPSGLSP